MERVFLDNNSTTSTKQNVKEAIISIIDIPLNASSVHSFGREAKKLLNQSRKRILKAVNAENAEVIFTSSGTEANNLAIIGCFKATSIIVSTIEHVSILKAAQKEAKFSGKKVIYLPVDENGVVRVDRLNKILKENKNNDNFLVSVMLANNETGVIQPIKKIADIVHKYGGYIHSDAIQAFGKMQKERPVDFSDLGIDMMTISSHKIGGGYGAGALIIKNKIDITPIIYGGSQENNNRAGTENIPSIFGFGIAAEDMGYTFSDELIRYTENCLYDYVEDRNDIEIFGRNVDRVYNTTFIAMKGMSSETQVINFDLAGIAVSNGSACSSGSVKKSHVLKAMNVNDEIASCAVRVSINENTQKSDMDRFIEVWKKNYNKVRNRQY